MPVNFFDPACQGPLLDAPEFGICDNQKSGKAFADTANRALWVATIENPGQIAVQFTAIDNCVPLLRADGRQDNRCDAMLTYQDNIVFAELKDVKENWRSNAIAQLESTIRHFMANHDAALFAKKRAFACNRQHPRFAEIDMEKKQRFYQEHRFRLHIGATIKI